jgi:tetratricopeptide (TPR) repeat protein
MTKVPGDATNERVLQQAAERLADAAPVEAEGAPPATGHLASRLDKLKLIESLGRAFRAAAQPDSAPAAALPARTWSHLRLLSKLGEGSFGEVYRAHDPVLDRDVALKLSKSAWAPGERRYLEEARRLAKVRHPNVVAVHGAEVHDGRVGLWTDLVEGETLEQLLTRAGPLDAREVALIGADVCRALAAVHAQGLVHGDVKASNVMRDRDGRVVLMDFGTVKEVSPGRGAVVTRGTPAVLAPELLRGEPPTPAADLYSAAVLLYQLVSGRYPVEGASVAEILGQHAAGAARPLRDVQPGVPVLLARVVEQALDGDPRRRPASAADMERALTGAVGPARAGRRRWRALAAAGLGALLAAAGALRAPGPPGPGAPPRTSVAVLGFRNLSGRADDAWLATALGEMLSTELAAGQKLRIVPGEQVARAKVEMGLAEADTLAPETLRRVRSSLGAEYVALGSYVALGGPGRVRVDVRLQDAAAGDTVAAVSETGAESDLFDIVSRTGARLRARLGAGGAGEALAGVVQASLPRNRDAARLYAEGLARLRVFDVAAARDLLEKAVAAEPDFPLAHSALASALAALGRDNQARQAAERAFQLAAGLPPDERTAVEARFREATREWARAVEIYRALRTRFPDELEHGLRLAAVQTASGKAKDALTTVTELRRLPSSAREDARIDLEEAYAAYALSDYRLAQASAARAVEKGRALGAWLLVARARLEEGASWSSLGEGQAALAAADDAQRLFAQARDELGAAKTSFLMSSILVNQGELRRAQEAAEEALAIYRRLGAGSGTALAIDRLGDLARDAGDLDGAEARFQEALPLERELGNPRGEASVIHSIGVVRYARGDLAAAKATFEEALAINRRIGHKAAAAYQHNSIANILLETGHPLAALESYGQALAIAREVGMRSAVPLYLNNIGEARLLLGEPERARAAHREALALSRALSVPSRVARSLRGLAYVLTAQGDLTGARALLDESIALTAQIGESTGLAGARQALAEVAIEQGRAAEAVALLRPVEEEWRRQKRRDGETFAHALLARAHFQANDGPAGEAELARSLALLPSIEGRDTRVWITAMLQPLRGAGAARVPRSCAAEPAGSALKALAAAAGDARRAGYAFLELQARLGLGEVELACGRTSPGRSRLAAVEKEARARGLVLVADKAARAARKPPLR